VVTPERDCPNERETAAQAPAERTEIPQLSAAFYAQLLNPPACKRGLECDNCGRCEH